VRVGAGRGARPGRAAAIRPGAAARESPVISSTPINLLSAEWARDFTPARICDQPPHPAPGRLAASPPHRPRRRYTNRSAKRSSHTYGATAGLSQATIREIRKSTTGANARRRGSAIASEATREEIRSGLLEAYHQSANLATPTAARAPA